ncbi:MAG: hypothetical protein OEU68_05695 [Nitrospira sp.]|jgi:hypothetical protein|nr:hypothetical protein [Nitrospira sp.]MDH4242510.1 hypothetical protein [Nitrospira sp.]MDH4355293.1 hypothetical protein [Nitrospira sp.]MDH5317473.1 hypothetical protein [Nitrospira sp.]
MRFEARELKPYAEPVSVNELKLGKEYFSVTFVDDEGCIPIIDTLIFTGKTDEGLLRFQDVVSYRRGVRPDEDTAEGHATFYECTEDQMNVIFDYERALDVLMCCSLKRRDRA